MLETVDPGAEFGDITGQVGGVLVVVIVQHHGGSTPAGRSQQAQRHDGPLALRRYRSHIQSPEKIEKPVVVDQIQGVGRYQFLRQ